MYNYKIVYKLRNIFIVTVIESLLIKAVQLIIEI